MVNHLNLNNDKDFAFLLIKSIKNGSITEETKIAVQENKSVNSIIKLLSITSPATLQDSSNFSEKEYFNVLMSEIRGIKEVVMDSREQKYLRPRNISIKKDITLKDEYLHIDIDKNTPTINIDNFFAHLDSIEFIHDLSRMSTPNMVSITFRTHNQLFGIGQLIDLAKQFHITFNKIDKDEIPF